MTVETPMSPQTENAATVAHILLEIEIDAPRERVWTALTDEIGAWWHKDFFVAPGKTEMRLDAKLGGWMAEHDGEGGGAIWGEVKAVSAPSTLMMVGDTGPDWGGPNRGIMQWDLAPVEGAPHKTTMRFRHALHGNVNEQTRASLDGGWKLLFVDCMKAYCETGERPAASDADMGGCEA